MKTSIIICTGKRPEAFKRFEYYLMKQTVDYRELEIIMVDDCTPKTIPTISNIQYFRGPTEWEEGVNTYNKNVEFALGKVTGDYIFIMEDDDYYHPKYIETLQTLLKLAPIVAEGNARYYHLGVPGHYYLNNRLNASLCSTAFRKSELDLMLESIQTGDLYFDQTFWNSVNRVRRPYILTHNTNLVIGIKGMPGRKGLGAGHDKNSYYYDVGHARLKQWLGDGSDFSYYRDISLKLTKGTTIKRGEPDIMEEDF